MRRWWPLVYLTLSPLSALGLTLIVFADLLVPAPAGAQMRERCFAETGYCIRGAILDYWERNGGLTVFGYPITELQRETIEDRWTGPVQWFERDRLEDHGIDGILAGRLGAAYLEQQGYALWDPANRTSAAVPGCEYFAATEQNLCEPFLSYWRINGGVERFGFPITSQRIEQIGEWEGQVQYFERRRMEYHPELPGTPILLGNLGRDILTSSPRTACEVAVLPELRDSFRRVPFQDQLGCPAELYADIPAALQPFERGAMLWLDLADGGRQIFALSTMPELFQQQHPDTWQDGEPVAPDFAAPPGLFIPQYGFGKLWATQPTLVERLGWATASEQADRATVQRFARGWLVWLKATNRVYAFGDSAPSLTVFNEPRLTPSPTENPGLMPGQSAPTSSGELIVRTYSVDFYTTPGSLTSAEVMALSTAVEQSIASGSTMLGSNLRGRVALRFEPAQTGPCAIRGLTLSGQRTIIMYYSAGSNLKAIERILAHEFIHQLQHDYYGLPYHFQSDNIMLEGQAVWASSPYFLAEDGTPYYHLAVVEALQNGALLPLTTSLTADCRTTTRNAIYEQWASFTEYLLLMYGRDRYDAVYRTGRGRAAGSSNYEGVYGKPLSVLESEWIDWLRNGAGRN